MSIEKDYCVYFSVIFNLADINQVRFVQYYSMNLSDISCIMSSSNAFIVNPNALHESSQYSETLSERCKQVQKKKHQTVQ